MPYVHLHRHSEWSLRDGVGTASQYAQRAAELGQGALGLSDHGSLSGALHHIKACNDANILPITGVEAYFKPDRHKKDKEHAKNWHLILIAKNLAGWHSLLRITSEAYITGHYYKPCVDFKLLQAHSEGLICSTACVGGYLPALIEQGDDVSVRDYLRTMKDIFKDDFYLEIMPHDFQVQRELNVNIANLAQEHSLPILATVDAHYPYQGWHETQDVVLMIGSGQSLERRKKKRERGEDVYQMDLESLYLMSEEEVLNEFKIHHQNLPLDIVLSAIDNTNDVVFKLTPFIIDSGNKLPRIGGGADRAHKDLRQWCEEGLERIVRHNNEQYRERVEYELGVFQNLNVSAYMWIIADMVRWARSQNIRVGAGRGSAAGSLVSYLVGITAVDPIAHDLLFERFMNPDRRVMPDIDIDFQHDRREDVKNYLAQKWGEDHVSSVVSHQTFQPKAALQKVSNVFDVPIKRVMEVTNTIEDSDVGLEGIRRVNDKIDKYAEDFPEVWKHALRIEGQRMNVSSHAAAVVLSDRPISEHMPMMRKPTKDGESEGEIVTAWSDSADFPIISDFGFLKIDILSTDGLTKQERAVRFIEERTGEYINLDDLPVCADPYAVEDEVMKAFHKGMTLGVFQFQRRGITNLIRQIKPTWLGDIAAANALYRPGPLEGGHAFKYAHYKSGALITEYWHPEVEPILKETYGLLIYQEQVMKIVQVIGGLSASEADDFRKAIGKLYRMKGNEAKDFMNQYKPRWHENAALKGMSEDEAERVWEMILAFGGYGFNKSHSVSYGVQAYVDMWLKIHYPAEFYAALLTYEPSKSLDAAREGRILGVEFSPPDINLSDWEFTLVDNKILWGLKSIKHLGDVGVNAILNHRPFTSYEDFCERVPPRHCNKRAKESLVSVGAFDQFGARDGWSLRQMMDAEVDVMGVAISGKEQTKRETEVLNDRIVTEDEFLLLGDDADVIVGGEIANVKAIKTRKGEAMAFIDLCHGTNWWSCTVFPKQFSDYKDVIMGSDLIMVRGRKDEERNQIIVNNICTVRELADALLPQV